MTAWSSDPRPVPVPAGPGGPGGVLPQTMMPAGIIVSSSSASPSMRLAQGSCRHSRRPRPVGLLQLAPPSHLGPDGHGPTHALLGVHVRRQPRLQAPRRRSWRRFRGGALAGWARPARPDDDAGGGPCRLGPRRPPSCRQGTRGHRTGRAPEPPTRAGCLPSAGTCCGPWSRPPRLHLVRSVGPMVQCLSVDRVDYPWRWPGFGPGDQGGHRHRVPRRRSNTTTCEQPAAAALR